MKVAIPIIIPPEKTLKEAAAVIYLLENHPKFCYDIDYSHLEFTPWVLMFYAYGEPPRDGITWEEYEKLLNSYASDVRLDWDALTDMISEAEQ